MEPEIRDELRKMPDEPLLPIERKLIAWSLGVGVVLMAILVFVSRMSSPAPKPAVRPPAARKQQGRCARRRAAYNHRR